MTRLHDGNTCLYGFADGRNENFLLDWKVLPATAPVPPPLDLVADPTTATYPRGASDRARAVEGYVDGRRVGDASACITFARVDEVAQPTRFKLEVSPYGSAEIFVDEALVAAIPSPRLAVIGNGVVIPLALGAGSHRIAVRTCPSGAYVGFYALVH